MLLQNVPPAILPRFLREHRSEWADKHMDNYTAAAIKVGPCSLSGSSVGNYRGQVILPLAHTIEHEEFLEVIKLEGVAHSPEDTIMPKEMLLLPILVWYQLSVDHPMTLEENALVALSTYQNKEACSNLLPEYKEFQNETISNIEKTELEIYLDEKPLDYDENEDLDVLNFWQINEKRFPILAIMARDILSIPITTVASESAFSIGGRVLTKYRCSTLPEHVQMLICTRNWLHGFAQNPNDEEDNKTICLGTTVEEPYVHQVDEIEE